MAKQKKNRYKAGDVLLTKAGTIITVKGIFYCNGCKENHYQLQSKVNGIYSHPVSRVEALDFLIPPTPAGKVLYGTASK